VNQERSINGLCSTKFPTHFGDAHPWKRAMAECNGNRPVPCETIPHFVLTNTDTTRPSSPNAM
jgi:hypothetical protein